MKSTLRRTLFWGALVSTGIAMADDEASQSRQETLDEGRVVYEQYCAGCHGLEGQGQPDWDRKNKLGELPAPPHGPEGHTWKHSDQMLYNIIAEGWRDPWNETDRKTMPAFKDILKPAEIRSVVEYLKTMWTPEQRQHQKEESLDAPFPESTDAMPGKDD